jgi:hypothetical protein
MKKKICTKCNELKYLDQFNKKGDGQQPYCRQCQNSWSKEHYRNNVSYYTTKAKKNTKKILDFVRELKSVPCRDCGIQYPYYVMDFDHLEDKTFNLGSAFNRFGREKLLNEIAKCEIVCSNCHRERTYERFLRNRQR